MTTKKTAQDLRRAGRNGDTQLVHMTRGEVAGLSALARARTGKPLPRNPKTGLPEANILKSMLPTILGAAATMVGGPMAGAAVGAATGAAMNPEDRWGGAALGAMGGYGGGQIAQGLTQAGANAAVGAGAQQAATDAATQAATQAATDTASQQAAQVAAAEAAGQTAAKAAGSNAALATDTAGRFSQAGQGLQSLAQPNGLSNFVGTAADKAAGTTATGMGGGYEATLALGKAVAPAVMAPPEMSDQAEEYGQVPKYRFDRTAGSGYAPGSGASSEQLWFNDSFTRLAAGGAVPPRSMRPMPQRPQGGPGTHSQGMSGMSQSAMDYLMGRSATAPMGPQATQAQMTVPQAAPSSRPQPNVGASASKRDQLVRRVSSQAMAEGGLVSLESGGFVIPADVVAAAGAGSSNAGMEALARKLGAKPIAGRGDGQSDSIPASIDGKHKARVARDEMTLTRAQVEAAGGAKKLYAMMDRIRQQATGTKKQMRPVKLDKALK